MTTAATSAAATRRPVRLSITHPFYPRALNVAVENRFQAGRKPKTRASPKTASSGTLSKKRHSFNELTNRRSSMGRYLLLWLLGVPIPILILIWAFGGLH